MTRKWLAMVMVGCNQFSVYMLPLAHKMRPFALQESLIDSLVHTFMEALVVDRLFATERQRRGLPLIAMDATLLSRKYMALPPREALEWIERLSNTCRHYNGIFCLLWHNTELIQSWQRKLYLEVLGIVS